MQDVAHIYKILDHLIESMEDAGIDPAVIDMILDAKEALEESTTSQDEED